MPAKMANFLKCFFSARLYRVHKHDDTPGHLYAPNTAEVLGDGVIKWLRFCWSVSYWTSPVIFVFLYRRGAFTKEGAASFASYSTAVGLVVLAAIWVRAVGRYLNGEYIEFLNVLGMAQQSFSLEHKRLLSRYDFDFSAWPVEFNINQQGLGDQTKVQIGTRFKSRGLADKMKMVPCHILSYLAIHTFGRRMVYPGTTALVNALVSPALIQGRAKLIEEKKGSRAKILTEEGNEIETLFIDRRNTQHTHGNILVICCEGNSGFYEIGATVTPLEAGYSVLGWNHPGFGGSTGVPFPEQEQNAVDAVMQFAMIKLGFQPGDIILFAWSIGGYPASWAAMNYPGIKQLVLDATFDHLVPLANARMPVSWRTLVNLTVKKYMNLNNAEQVCRYPGPILLIRRSKDEMITTVDPLVIASNRGNDLLIKLLQCRYPQLVTEDTLPELREWLATDKAGQELIKRKYDVEDKWCESILQSYVEENDTGYPLAIGEDLPKEDRIQLTLFLASVYMVDFDATHCQPLPGNYLLREPWTIA